MVIAEVTSDENLDRRVRYEARSISGCDFLFLSAALNSLQLLRNTSRELRNRVRKIPEFGVEEVHG